MVSAAGETQIVKRFTLPNHDFLSNEVRCGVCTSLKTMMDGGRFSLRSIPTSTSALNYSVSLPRAPEDANVRSLTCDYVRM